MASGDAEAALARLREIDEAVDRVLAAVQRIAADLRPLALDELGLRAALAEAARQFSERTGTPCAFVCTATDAALGGLPAALETAAFRVVQEALTNVARHAGAQSVRVELGYKHGVPLGSGGTLRAEVVDDGRGVTVAPDSDSLGLLGMRERTAEWGGSLSVGPVPGGGTRIRATFVVFATGPASGPDATPDR